MFACAGERYRVCKHDEKEIGSVSRARQGTGETERGAGRTRDSSRNCRLPERDDSRRSSAGQRRSQTSSGPNGRDAPRRDFDCRFGRSRMTCLGRFRSITTRMTGSRITIQIANSDAPKLRSLMPTSPLFPAGFRPWQVRWRPRHRIPTSSRFARLGRRRPIPTPEVRSGRPSSQGRTDR